MMTRLLRTLAVVVVLCGATVWVYYAISRDLTQEALAEVRAENAELQRQRDAYQAMVERLSRSRRIAHVIVENQQRDESGAIIETSIQFIELDEGGSELARQSFNVPGDVLFIDAWTVKFEADEVAQGHPLCGRTLILLRRVYSDLLAPIDGLPIDTPGAIPPAYATSEIGRFERKIWDHFWLLASDTKRAKEMGVRVAQGEAVYKLVKAGQKYELIVDNAGGMSLTPLDEATAVSLGKSN